MKHKLKYCPYCMTPVTDGESCPGCGLTAGTYVPSPHHLRPGTILMDRYLVGRALGEGGFGITYIGCDLRLELKVAIKEYYPVDKASRNASQSPDLVGYSVGPAREGFERGKKKFLNEARTMAKMDKQQAIVSVRDYFEANNTAYIVMEYIEGTTFTDLVAQKGGRIPPQELFSMIEPLFKALTTLHKYGLIHRDISPDNLMLENGEVRLIDFGCARESDHGNETLTITLKHGYAPIEQYQQKGQGPWTDVYALCATIYFCLVGQKPPQALDRIGGETSLMLPSKLGVGITQQQEAAILKGLNLSPRGRFQSMEELHGALYPAIPEQEAIPNPQPEEMQEIAFDTTQEPTLDQDVEKSAHPQHSISQFANIPKKWLPWLAGAAILLVVVLAVGLLPKTPTDTPVLPTSVADASVFQESAYILSESDTNMERLEQLMDDPGVSALVLPEGQTAHITYLDDGNLFSLTKPLQIADGAYLRVDAMEIDAGGYLEVLGMLDSASGDLRLKGDVLRLSFPEGTENHLSSLGCSLWLESDQNMLSQDQTNLQEAGACRFVLRENPEEAREVTTLEQLVAATEEEDLPNGIKITRDLTIDRELSIGCPLYICEGVTVNTAGDWTLALYDSNSALVNYGTLNGNVWTDQGAPVLNFGQMNTTGSVDGVSLWFNENSRSVFLNAGTVKLSNCSRLWENNHMVNTPTGTLEMENFYLLDSCLSNYGEILALPHESESIYLSTGAYLDNVAGRISLEPSAIFVNNGIVHNQGQLDVLSGGTLVNQCVIQNDYGTLQAQSGSHLQGINSQNQGVYYSTGGEVTLACANAPHVYEVLDGTAIQQLSQSSVAATPEQLDTLLEDRSVDAITIQGTISYPENLKLTKDLYIRGTLSVTEGDLIAVGSRIILAEGGQLEADNLSFLENAVIQLEGGTLSVQKEGHLLLDQSLILGSGNGQLQAASANLQLQNRAAIAVSLDSSSDFLSADNSSIQMEGHSFLIPSYYGMTVLSGAAIDITDSLLSAGNRMQFTDCVLSVQENGVISFFGSGVTINSSSLTINQSASALSHLCDIVLADATVSNTGLMNFSGWEEHSLLLRDSSISNKAEINLWLPTIFEGSDSVIENQGRLRCSYRKLDRTRIVGNAPIFE